MPKTPRPDNETETSNATSLCSKHDSSTSKQPEFAFPNSIKKGDTVIFGSYPYTKNGQKASIEWIVLAKRSGKALLISKYALGSVSFNTIGKKSITWRNSSLRTWLNDTFYKEAFNEQEKSLLVDAKVKADKKKSKNAKPERGTIDKVFILSVDETSKYLKDGKLAICVPTEYAFTQGVKTGKCIVVDGKLSCCFWSRSTEKSPSPCAYAVIHGTSLRTYDEITQNKILRGRASLKDKNAVRPAIWVKVEW